MISRVLVKEVRTMDLHPLSKATSALASMSDVIRSTLATQAVVTSTQNQNAITEREVTVNKVTRAAAGIIEDRSTQPHLSSSLHGLMENHTGLDSRPLSMSSSYFRL